MIVHPRYKKFIQAALVIGPMTMLMAVVGVIRNYGLNDGWPLKIILTWLTMFPIAFCFALFIIPLANKVMAKINFSDKA